MPHISHKRTDTLHSFSISAALCLRLLTSAFNTSIKPGAGGIESY